jgi:catechol 2,3-dioxygenase-like lactoylglutathione lyase family enzyme
MPHVFRVIVPVGDIERAALFYGALLGAVGSRVSPGRHYFECEGTILACYDPQADGDGRDAQPLPEPIYIAVDDLESIYASAETAGASFSSSVVPGAGPLGQIARRPWGERSFYAADPFGNPLCFVSRDSVFTGPTDDRS